MNRSELYLIAWMATEKALPEESLQLIYAHDKLFAKWREAGFSGPVPDDLRAADLAIQADPFASIPFELRQKTNQEASKEWRAANLKEAA